MFLFFNEIFSDKINIMKQFITLFLSFILLIFSSLASLANDKETLIILDQSASMLDSYKDATKIEYAVRAVVEILNSYSDSDSIGLRTVGVHPLKMFELITQNPNALCEATALLNDIQTDNKENIVNSLQGVFPSGASPLQYTLQLAINNDFYLGTKLKHIILVTDGYENCDGDPCMYIRKIMVSRNDLKIDVVGIGLNNEDKNLLSCLTSATKGQVHNVVDIADINTVVNSLSGYNPVVNYQTTSFNKPVVDHSYEIKSYLYEFFE